jgi:Mg/Co/Ni transporter MgtE
VIEDDIELLRQALSSALDTDDNIEISKILSRINVADTALLLDSLPSQQRDAIWPLIDPSEPGAVIPVVLRQIGIDPAIAGGVVLTTVTDVVGIIAFLGLATLIMG